MASCKIEETYNVGIQEMTNERPLTCDEVLEIIDNTLAQGSHESSKLWSVLTGLRGPDSRNRLSKMATTEVIRSTAFPRTHINGMAPANFGCDRDENVLIRERLDWGHFRNHVVKAFEALSLSWQNLNEPRKPK